MKPKKGNSHAKFDPASIFAQKRQVGSNRKNRAQIPVNLNHKKLGISQHYVR